jgi:hypothetical protein
MSARIPLRNLPPRPRGAIRLLFEHPLGTAIVDCLDPSAVERGLRGFAEQFRDHGFTGEYRIETDRPLRRWAQRMHALMGNTIH